MTFFTQLFFRQIPVTGFALMRIGWAAVVLVYDGGQIFDVARNFSGDGLLTPEIAPAILRSMERFSIFDWIQDPASVFALYLLLLLCCVCMIVGLLPRLSTVVAVLLLFSFHERNPLSLGGGDTVLRHIGFLLLLAPVGNAFSLKRLRTQWNAWREKKELLPPETMSSWPQTLLLWQLGVIYVASGWDKMVGSMWLGGTAVNAALHHPHFSRIPFWAVDALAPLSPFIGYATILFECTWLLLLLPAPILEHMNLTRGTVKRALLLMGTTFHLGIFLLMDVGSFSWAMLIAFLGTLDTEDFDAMRKTINDRWDKKKKFISVLYDGHCGLCQRSVFALALMDHLSRLRLIDFHDDVLRMKSAADIRLQDLDLALHIRISKQRNEQQGTSNKERANGSPFARTEKGFDALRILAWHLPPLWPLAPFLYIPSIPPLGRRIYARIASRRKRCSHKRCHF